MATPQGDFVVTWPGLEETVARLEPGSFFTPVAETFMRESARAIRIAGQAQSPVDTGFMRASHVEMTGNGSGFDGQWGVKVTAPYAVFVHNGTRRRAGRPWLANVMVNAATILREPLQRFVDALERRWRGSL